MMIVPSYGLVATLGGSLMFGWLALGEMRPSKRSAGPRLAEITRAAAQSRRTHSRLTARTRSADKDRGGFKQRVVSLLRLQTSKEASSGRQLLSRAGILSPHALNTYLFLRVTMPALFGLIGLIDGHVLHVLPFVSRAPTLAAGLLTMLGFYAPVLMLKNRITRRQAELRKSLPDGLDLLVICVESGASINESFARVGRELARGHPALATEFATTAAELSFLPVRRVALENLLERTGLPGIRGLVTTMLQSERFGTPIAQALRVLSAEFREQRMMAAENKAAKLPVLLTVPMMIFILPVLFIVLLGPAALTILDAMAKK